MTSYSDKPMQIEIRPIAANEIAAVARVDAGRRTRVSLAIRHSHDILPRKTKHG